MRWRSHSCRLGLQPLHGLSWSNRLLGLGPGRASRAVHPRSGTTVKKLPCWLPADYTRGSHRCHKLRVVGPRAAASNAWHWHSHYRRQQLVQAELGGLPCTSRLSAGCSAMHGCCYPWAPQLMQKTEVALHHCFGPASLGTIGWWHCYWMRGRACGTRTVHSRRRCTLQPCVATQLLFSCCWMCTTGQASAGRSQICMSQDGHR
mmetsp:Transcript_11404/g.34284  ORF Transcript_11404/g.34284 Transcript_11404/m.34284 type:complete len:204 (+) Transcript_11404:1182-1793(+)